MPHVEEKQCRICLDGEDPVMGRLIRPCLCKGSVKVRGQMMTQDATHSSLVRSCEMSTALAQLFCQLFCFLFLSSMQISLSFWPHSGSRYRDQSRHVLSIPMGLLLIYLIVVIVGTI